MKKLLLLLVIAFLPVFGFGQTNLVRWNGANIQANPALLASNVSANAVAGNFVTDNYSNPFPGFRGTGYNNSTTTPDYANYMEFAIKANSGYNIALSSFVFTHAKGDGGAQKFEVRYSTDSSIGTAVGGITSVTNSPATKNIDLTGVTVASGTTLYIRVYPFNRENASWTGGTFHIKHGTTSSGATPDASGPTIRGTVSAVSCTASTAPLTISGNSNVCPGSSITLTASGGTHGSSAVYEWSTNASFTNIISGQSTATLTHTPTANSTTYYVRRKDVAPCTVATTAAAGPKTVTRGYVGDELAYGNGSWIGYVYDNATNFNNATLFEAAKYRGYVTESETFDRDFGTGSISGTNLCGTYANTFGVRYKMKKNFPAGYYTFTVGGDDGYRLSIDGGVSNILSDWGDHVYGTQTTSSTYYLSGDTNLILEYYENATSARVSFSYVKCDTTTPTGVTITGTHPITCAGSQVTLAATGITGTAQWGTGTVVGQNIIGTGTSINVTPQATTTYWVRQYNNCGVYSAGITKEVTVSSVGNPAAFGNNVWNVYGYETDDNSSIINIGTAFYRGYYTENKLSFTTTERWATNLSPSSANAASGTAWAPSGCAIDNDTFVFVYKRKGFECGNYNLTLTNWDDAVEVLVNGVSIWSCNGWYSNGNSGCNGNLGTFSLTSDTTIEIRVKEQGGDAGLALSATLLSSLTAPTAPTTLTGNTTICSGESTTLTAGGGTAGTPNTYQWGTGAVGTNVIANQTGASITVSQTATTTYWVRRYDSCAGTYTGHLSIEVVTGTPGNPALYGANTWNVYGFASGGNNAPANYKGYYVQNTLGFNTQAKWDANNSPSYASDWQGCAVPVDGFTMIHKRKGFPCGSYQINLLNYDDDTVVIINGTSYNYNGYNYNTTAVGTFSLNANSTIEVRTTDVGGGGSSANLELVAITSIYNGTWNVANPSDTAVQINTNLTVASDLEVCSCTVKAGQTLTVNSDKTFTVIGNIVVEEGGKIIVENNGSLVQVDNDATYTGLPSSFTAKRNTQPVRKYDFTYWTSPVRAQDWKLVDLSPNTLADKYYGYNPAGSWIVYMGGNEHMQLGRGYGVRAPQTFSETVEAVYATKFIGIPNSGIKTITLGGANSYNLIGNPYPSALDADKFITENEDKIIGTLYFWTHNTPMANYVYSAADYAAYNKLGGVGTQAAASGGLKPTRNIASGQAFFVQRKNNADASVTFRNEMRVVGSNNQFYRPGQTETDNTIYKHRFWLNVSNANQAYSELLVGYMTGATDAFDDSYDGETFGGNVISMYSKLNQMNLAIQGKGLPFDENDVIPLGYTTTVGGQFTINLGDFDGAFEAQDVFLEDKLNNTITNLKETNYVFTTATGTFDNRFEVKFVNTTLGVDVPTVADNSIVVFRNGSQIDIKSKDQTIDQVIVYDLLGKVIFDKNKINANSFSTSQLTASNQVVIVKVITDTKAELVKKVIMN